MKSSRPFAQQGRTPELYAARLHDRLVILDVADGQYLSLHDPEHGVTCTPHGSLEAAQPGLVAALDDAGLLARAAELSSDAPRNAAAPPLPEQPVALRLAPADLAAFILALLCTAVDLRRPLQALTRPRSTNTAKPVQLQRHAAAFRHLLVWSPWQGECLFRSRLLLRFLQLRGVSARWVFGVRGWPFQAHCWVEGEHGPINESADKLAAYRTLATF